MAQNYLIQKVEVFRCETEDNAKELLEKIRDTGNGEVTKYSLDNKNQKSKGDIIDEWIELKVTREFNDKKLPETPLGEIV